MTALGDAMADLRFERARAEVARRTARELECDVASGLLDPYWLGLYRAEHADALDGSAAASALWRFWRLALAASAAICLLLVLAVGPADARPRKGRGAVSAEASVTVTPSAEVYDGILWRDNSSMVDNGRWEPARDVLGAPMTVRTSEPATWDLWLYFHPLTPELAQLFARRRR